MEPNGAAPALHRFLDGLITDATPVAVADAVAALQRAVRDDAEGTRPFLSVILRTQGTRIEPLREALSSLSTQSYDDFEVVLVVHSADAGASARVNELVAEQPRALSDRIRTHVVTSGGRSAPLNAGLENAQGRYVAVFDDDDLLLEDWVSTFAESEAAAAGRLMRARVGTQDVRAGGVVDGIATSGIHSPVRDEYPLHFDAFRHFELNASPFMGWAFPRILFSRLGVRFDESLDLCEDWDVVLRGTTMLGVHEIDRVTAVYRRWSTADSSVATESGADWAASERVVIERLDSAPLLLDAGSVHRIRGLLADSDALNAIKTTRSWRIAEAIRHTADVVRRIVPGLPRRGE